MRKATVFGAAAAVMVGIIGVASSVASANPIPLSISQNTAFRILGYWCGGISEKVYATQFDPVTGYPDGAVYLSTTCSGSGRGGTSMTHTAWAAVMWDFTGAVVSASALSPAPAVNPTLTITDPTSGATLTNNNGTATLTLAPGYVPVPRVVGISATTGPASGGTSVTITGTGFTGATAVDFGSTPATYTVVSDTSITTVSPSEGAGTVGVTVTTAGGTDTPDANDQFTFVAAPTITGISPTSGPVEGGTSVTVTGTHLSGAQVTFGGSPVGYYPIDDSSFSFTTPVGDSIDSESITVTTIGGTASSPTLFNYTANAPDAPVMGTATPGDTSATVDFSPPANDGGAFITSYTVTAADATNAANGGQTASSVIGPITVSGLTDGDSYTFTVTATNLAGTSAPSAASNAVVPAIQPTVPDAPVIGTATAGDTTATVTFSPPASDGGSSISSYTVTAVDGTNPANGGQTASGPGSPVTVTGLTDGDSYTFLVYATNLIGPGSNSAASNAVVPAATPPPPPPAPFAVVTSSLPDATRGVVYRQPLQATGATTPYRWSGANLPKGLRLHPNGTLSGRVNRRDTPGPYVVTVTVTSKASGGQPAQTATATLTLTVL